MLGALERELIRQLALELYQAGATSGPLSRQYGEQMSSYVLRREAWWNQLSGVGLRGAVQQGHPGRTIPTAGSMEQQLIRSTMNNDLADLKKLTATLRD